MGINGPQVTEEKKGNSGRGRGQPRVTELVGGRAELIIPIILVVLGAQRRERVLVRQPRERPGPSPTSGPTLSLVPLVTLSLASFPTPLSAWTPDPPPCLSPQEVDGVGSPRSGAHEP